MGLYVLDNVKLYEADEDNLIHLAFGDSVWLGCQVAAHGVPDMGVRVNTGTIRYAGLSKSVAQTDLTVAAADPTNPRVDLVHIPGASGVPAIVAGTAASTPKPPALPAASILVGFVSVAAAAINIQSSNINDRRLIASDGVVGGLDANKPAPLMPGRLYAARDTGILYHDDGVTLVPLGGATQSNLLLNSDFGRRTVLGLAMPEVFADASGTSGGAMTVAANVGTITGSASEVTWCAGSFVWRDGRMSAAFKATTTAATYDLRWRIDANNYVMAEQTAGNFTLVKVIAGTPTTLYTVANALTLNNWYWLEIEKQGTTFMVRIYNTGGTAPGVTKASSTLLFSSGGQAVADAGVQTGAHLSLISSIASSQWGGIAASPGGVYVETWLPESWALTFAGTLGGQAFGYDEAADSGPLAKQYALRCYVPPAANWRAAFAQFNGPDGGLPQSTAFASSIYLKTSGITGGNGTLNFRTTDQTSAQAAVANHDLFDAQEAVWTRKTLAWSSGATARRFSCLFQFNVNNVNAGGTYWVSLPQVEQGSAATAWRAAPADDGTIVLLVQYTGADKTTTSGSLVELDSRDSALNFFAPWDCTAKVEVNGIWWNNSAGQVNGMSLTIDGGNPVNQLARMTSAQSSLETPVSITWSQSLAAGKHRIAVTWLVTAGVTATMRGGSFPVLLRVTLTRGK